MKVALVTAGRAGIGRAIVDTLLTNGYYVAVTGRSLAALEEDFDWGTQVSPTAPCVGSLSGKHLSQLLFIKTDVTNINDCNNAVEMTVAHFGQLDLLVNNAGGATLYQTFEHGTSGSFDEAFNLNVRSVFFMSQFAIPFLIETRGCIINVSSVLGQRPAVGLGPYCAAKAAVEMLTKTAALELAPKQVRVLCIAPSATQTEFHVNAGMTDDEADEYYKSCASIHPLGRVGKATDMAELVLFLADSRKSGFMTGAVIPVDGGRLLTSASAFKK